MTAKSNMPATSEEQVSQVPTPDYPGKPKGAKEFELRLYVAGQTAKSMLALQNLRRYCEEHLEGKYSIEIIDLLENPQLAEGDQILAIPTLVRRFPEPVRKIIGDLSNEDKVLIGLDLKELV